MDDLTVGILAFDGADELDVVGPYRTFAAVNLVREHVPSPAVRLELIAPELKQITFANGLKIEPTTDYANCPPLDLLIAPGGGSNAAEGRRKQQKNPDTLAFVRERSAQARLTGSVCTGAFILAESGLLAERFVSTHWLFRTELEKLMAERGEPVRIVHERVAWDEPIVTAGGVTSGIDLSLEIIEKLCGADVRKACEGELELQTPR